MRNEDGELDAAGEIEKQESVTAEHPQGDSGGESGQASGGDSVLGQAAGEKAISNAFATKRQGAKRHWGTVTVPGFFTEKLFEFNPREMRFMREYSPDVSLEEAAKKAGVPVEYCEKMLRKKSVQEFLQDKFQQIAVQQGWTVERWMAEGDKVWRGKKLVSREQMEVWKEFGQRILPKSRVAREGEGGDKPTITININAVDEAFKRQKAIEAEIIDGKVR